MRRQKAILGAILSGLGVLACGEPGEPAVAPVEISCPLGKNKLAVNVWSGGKVVYAVSTRSVLVNALGVNGMGPATAVLGRLSRDEGVFVGRDGPMNSGAFTRVGEYDASAFPFISAVKALAISPEDVSISTPVYFGYVGTWNITSVPGDGAGWFEGRLNATSVVDQSQEDCWEDASCKPIEGGRIEACFGVWRDGPP